MIKKQDNYQNEETLVTIRDKTFKFLFDENFNDYMPNENYEPLNAIRSTINNNNEKTLEIKGTSIN